MSLQVWLPLNGDLKNKGCSNLTFSNKNTTYTKINTSGKIGSCYENTNNKAGGLVSDKTIDLGINQSMCCWINVTSFYSTASLMGIGGQHRYGSNIGMGLTLKYISATTGYLSVNTGTGSSRTFNTYTGTTILNANTWYHVCYTYDGANIRLYVNGNLDKTHPYTGQSSPADYIGVFCWSLTGTNSLHADYQFNGRINDFRVYDHTLSSQEIKEISKGLVLHYTLDQNVQQMNNCFASPTFDTSAAGGGWNHWGNTGHAGSYGQNTNKDFIYNKNNTYSHWVADGASATANYLCYQSPAFDGGFRSLQCILKEENGLPITESIVFPTWNANAGGATLNKWTEVHSLGDGFYYCKVDGLKQDGSNDLVGLYVLPGKKVYISECYLENNYEYCSDIFSKNKNIVYDTSGNGYNGTITGNLDINSNTPRNNKSIYFTSNSSYIKIDNLITSNFGNSYTFAWWGKIDNYSYMQWGFSNGIRLNGVFQGNLWNTGDSGSNPLYKPGTTTQVTAPSTNVWHHWVMTGDGTNCKVYLDGVYFGIAKTYKSISGTSIFINGWDTGTSYSSSNYQISDFRIYSTALSAEDAKALYEISAKIDKNGNLFAYNYEEQ